MDKFSNYIYMYFQFTKLQYAHKGAQHFMLFSVFDVTRYSHKGTWPRLIQTASGSYMYMRGSRNFHERGSNENGNFLSQTRGGPTPKKSRNYLFF